MMESFTGSRADDLKFKYFPILILLGLFALFPFFEGAETPIGLLLVHGLILLSLMIFVITASRLWIPPFIFYFLSFFIAIGVSTFVAAYRYASFLQLWDFCIAALFSIFVCSLLKEYQQQVKGLNFYLFCAGTIAIITSALTQGSLNFGRVTGAFLNPNYFAAFSLLLILLGLFVYQHESDRWRKLIVTVLLLILVILVILPSSRSVYLASAILALLYLRQKKPSRLITSVIFSILILGGVVLWLRFYQFSDPYRYYRLKIWKYSLKGILDDPYLGIGLNMLNYHASRFNFPADTELGRYSRIARSADNQYLQILAETGFLGLFTFLIGWGTIYFILRRTPERFFFLKQSYLVISVVSFFSLPLNDTSLLLLFLYMICVPMIYDPKNVSRSISLSRPGRILVQVFIFLLFYFAVYLPFAADWQFKKSLETFNDNSSEIHLQKAMRLNPFQPYYSFAFVKRIVEAQPHLEPAKWVRLVELINESIVLNPLEPDFYTYKARIFRTLLDQTRHFSFYTEAVSSYQAALGYDPYNVFLRGEFAYFLFQYGRLSLAEDELSKALTAEPAFLNGRLLLATMQLEEKKRKEAQATYLEFEKYYARYGNMDAASQPGYIRKLLEVNHELRDKLRKEFSAGNS